MAVDGSLNFDTKIDTKGFKAGTNTIKTQANGLKGTLLSLGKTIGVVFGITQLIRFGKQAINTASDLQEVQNVVDTAFGEMSYKMEQFAASSIKSFGMSKLAAKQTGSTFMAMARGMGLGMDSASDMSIALTGLSGDMASFYNVSQDVASTALKSIFTGETETLKQYGIVMTQANLQAFAYSQGVKKNVQDMTQAEQVQLRYNYVMQQTALAQGDFAKTSGSWANQTRILSEQFKELLGILGQGLIQVLSPVVKFLNTALSYLITFANTVGRVLSSVFNLGKGTAETAKNTAAISTSAEGASTGLSDMGKSAKKASKEAKGSAAGFDQLNNITESVAGNAEDAADSMAGMGGLGGGAYGFEVNPTINPADTTALEAGLSATISNIQTGLNMFLSFMSSSFGTIFSSIWTNLQAPIQNFKLIMTGVFTDLQTLIQPLIDYFINFLIPMWQTTFITLGSIVVGLFDTFNRVFSDIWNLAVFPIIENFIKVVLPMITEMSTKVIELLGVLFEEVKKIFDMVWNDAVAPVIGFISKVWVDLMNTLKEFWDKWGTPIFDALKEAVRTTGDLFRTIWKTILKPIFDTFMKVVDELWTNHLKPLLANFLDFVGELAKGALDIYNKFIAPVVKWFVEKLGPPITKVIQGIIYVFGQMMGGVADAISGIITTLKGVIQFITGVFTGDWKKAWTGIQNVFKGIWDALVGIVKVPINLIIDIVNGLISGITAGVNSVIRAINSLNFTVPDWVPLVGGNSIGFNVKEFTAPKIPKLATGTVVPANYGEFMAILGDNKRETEVVSPLSTMKQAFKEALSEMGGIGQGTVEVNIYLEGKQIHAEVVRQDRIYKKKTGKSAFA